MGDEIEALGAALKERVAARDELNAGQVAAELWKAVREASIEDEGVRHRTAVTLIMVANVFRAWLGDAHGAAHVLRRAFEWADATPYDVQRPSYREEIAWRVATVFEDAKCHRSAVYWYKQALALARSRSVADHVMRNLKGVAWNLEALEDEPGSESPKAYYDDLLQLAWPETDVEQLRSRLWMTNCAAMYALTHGDEARGLEVLSAHLALVTDGEGDFDPWFGVSIHGVGLHYLATGRPEAAIALADSMAGHAARFGADGANWFAKRMHGLKARAYLLQQRFDAALDEIRQVFDIDAAENFSFGHSLRLEDVELWLDVARIHVHRQAYGRASIAYQFAAWAYGERSAGDSLTRTARMRIVWIERQAAVVHEMASLWLDLAQRPERDEVQQRVANALLQLKTNLYQSTAGNRLLTFRHDPKFVKRLFSANRRFAAAARQSLKRPDDHEAALRMEDMLFLREQVEAKLISGTFEMMPSIAAVFHFDFRQLRKLAGGRCTLIDYSLVDYRPPSSGQAGRPQGQRYIGVKITQQAVQLVDLREAAAIDADAEAFTRACARRRGDKLMADRHLGRYDAPAAVGDPLELGRRLYNKLIAPFGALDGQLVVSPDGALAAVPFHALRPDDQHFLIEQRDVAICHSLLTQEGLDFQQRSPGMRITEAVVMVVPDVLLLGDPDYADVGLERLMGTRDEVERIGESYIEAGWKPPEAVHRHLGADADVTHATRTLYPHVLHIAAHGSYARNDRMPPSVDLIDQRLNWRRLEDSGARALSRFDAALLSAFLTLSLDPNTENGEFEDIDRRRLTALELSSLNLVATRLVVLSACETGLGRSERGAGVLGFQYALGASFAANALVSLWRVPDKETADLMIDLYRRVLAEPFGGYETTIVRTSYADALRSACRVDGKAVHPYYWASFTYLGAR